MTMEVHREYMASVAQDGTLLCIDFEHEIVRCRDCKHYRDHMWVVITDVDDVCLFWHGEPTKVEPNGFCAWGERRDA